MACFLPAGHNDGFALSSFQFSNSTVFLNPVKNKKGAVRPLGGTAPEEHHDSSAEAAAEKFTEEFKKHCKHSI